MPQTTMDWTGANDAFSGNYSPPSTASGAGDPGHAAPGTFMNNGDFTDNPWDALAGQANAPDQVYFGGSPGAAGAMSQGYRGQAITASQNKAPQIGMNGMNAIGTQMGNAAAGQENARYGNQQAQNAQYDALTKMGQAASGYGTSAAQTQMQQSTDTAMNANMAMANSARGQAGAANAQKNALVQNGVQGQQAANASAQLRAQEMQQAQGQYAQMANQMQNQYGTQQQGYAQMGMAGANAIQGNALGQAQLQAGQNALNQQGQLGYEQLGFNSNAEQMQAQMNNQNNAYQLNESNAKAMSGAIGGVMGAIGGAAMLSDARAKHNIRDAGPKLDEALNSLHGYQYEYKDGMGQELGTKTGIMAQDLASTDAGSKLVGQHPSGAMGVKVPEATGFALAAVARLNDKINTMQRGNVFGDAKLQEPNGGAAGWTLREEPDFILAKNDRTGDLQKVMTMPLSPAAHHQAVNRPHGAGPIYGDMPIGGSVPGAPVPQQMGMGGPMNSGPIAPINVQAGPAQAAPDPGGGIMGAMTDKMTKGAAAKLNAAAAGKGQRPAGSSGNFTGPDGQVDPAAAQAYSNGLAQTGYGMTDAQTGAQWNVPAGGGAAGMGGMGAGIDMSELGGMGGFGG